MTINFGDTHIEMGWECSLILIAVILIIILLILLRQSKSVAMEKWVCPKCYTVFNVTWKQAFPVNHFNEDVSLKCPKCKKRYYCSVSHEK